MSGQLILLRHGESQWNAQNLFTGWANPGLSENGKNEARAAGRLLAAREITPDEVHTSVLRRAIETADLALAEMPGDPPPTFRSEALNERDYGDLTGLNKDAAREKWGAEQVHLWRRSFDIAPPGGESLKDTLERVRPHYESRLLPAARAGKTLLVAAHGNSLRAMMVFLEGLSADEIQRAEIATGEGLLYRIAADGTPTGKENLTKQEKRE